MKNIILLLTMPIFLYAQFSGWGCFGSFIPTDDYSPVSSSTLWSFQGQKGKTVDGDTVTAWVDQVASNSANLVDNAPDDDDAYLTFGGADVLSVSANATTFNLGTGDFTISGKAMATNTGLSNFIAAKFVNNADYWQLYAFGDDLRLASEVGNVVQCYIYTADANNYLSDNTPFTFTMVFDRDGSGTIYIDGQPVSTTTSSMSATALDFNTSFQLGAKLTTGHLTGRIYWLQCDTGLKDATWALNFYNYLQNNGY